MIVEETVSKIKTGKLIYRINVVKEKVKVRDEYGVPKEIEVAIPSFLISLLSSMKRDDSDSSVDYKPTGNPIRDKVRKTINKTYNKMYKKLTPEEAEKYESDGAMLKITKTFMDYFKNNKPEYIMFSSYKDDKKGRDKAYDIILRRNGYRKVVNDGGWVLYTNGYGKRITKIMKQSNPSLVNTMKDLMRNF